MPQQVWVQLTARGPDLSNLPRLFNCKSLHSWVELPVSFSLNYNVGSRWKKVIAYISEPVEFADIVHSFE